VRKLVGELSREGGKLRVRVDRATYSALKEVKEEY
jgi:hypothetical protein